MKRNRTLLTLSLGLALAAPLALLAGSGDIALSAAPTKDQSTTARMVYGLLSDSRYAYRPRALDDALSREILTEYLKTLDPGKVFLTAQDVAGFDKYATTLDDAIKSGQVDPAWAIFDVYRRRVDERISFARKQLKADFDFSKDERYAYDRKDAPWADAAGLDTLWRQSVKNDWLRLKLAGKPADEIRKTLDKRYANLLTSVQQLKGDEVFQSFMNAYTGSIDPHTDYMNPRSAENFNMQMSNSLEGIGAVLFRQDDVVVVREMVPGGPAARSGRLKPGDRIVGVGQGVSGEVKDVIGWRIDDVVQLIRGAANTQVRLDVVPAEAPLDSKPQLVTITRAKVRLEDARAKAETIVLPAASAQPARRIGVIKLPGFYQDFEARRRGDKTYASATRDVAKMLADFRAQKVDGVVLDLRGNGGGSLSEAVELTGLFIDKGPVVQVRESGGKVNVQYDQDAGVAWDGPLAVLVNRGSASASEIVAGAIKDYGRGLIIGETTFGKGTVQTMVDLDRWPANETPRFGEVKLTVAQFFRPDGSSTQNKGVEPDVAFPVSVDASEFGESTYPNALPWTRIAAASHLRYGNFAPLLAQLDALHQARSAKDVEYQWWVDDVRKFRAETAKKSISLNEAERRAERDKFDAQRQQRAEERKRLGINQDPLLESRADDGLAADERNVADSVAREEAAKKQTDPLLRESAAILGDAIGMLGKDAKLAAQVLPATHNAAGHWAD
ncbi:carboxy terminal-processing peptidase [Thermomonas sp.]|uniref:carboxy terminal-processing peptidase n=1 Tax=Thermomonas sp. TaxID=1971895 RepID=UPI00238A7025|nr:carboxy terminal-processing peptidase [Thermomonas sp.]MDE2380975.1 carboxy terminal-processing peptidase [Xanthomonadaceae bacterium]HOC11745.1 carboxy terminal-processing peptidase [Thermomonas sp.]HQA01992.1 carboxy terminal-processing peptidase [Thermomonas sp.]HQE07869.1 carboxy terminal-processing peptidase [Thermomonas sp.]